MAAAMKHSDAVRSHIQERRIDSERMAQMRSGNPSIIQARCGYRDALCKKQQAEPWPRLLLPSKTTAQ